jgi:hypothetical protein
MPGRESQEENADASLSKRRNPQLPDVPRLARAATWIGLDTVPEKKDDLTPPRDRMPLKKSGVQKEIAWTRRFEKHIRKLSEKRPDQFQVLHRLLEGDIEDVTEKQFGELRLAGYLAPDNSPLPWVKDIMTAALRRAGDGLCIVDPLDVRTPEEVATVQRVDEQLEAIHAKRLEYLHRRLTDKNEEEDKGHTR